MKCSVEGCGRPVKCKSLCCGHYERQRRLGSPTAGQRAFRGEALRFFREVILRFKGDDCLTWPYGKPDGRARMAYEGRDVLVSRIACEKVNGLPPTPKHQAAHLCGNGHLGCVNPRHLSWKTHTENMADKLIHGTHNRGERHGMAKLKTEDVLAIRSLRYSASQDEIARKFGVCPQYVGTIQRGKAWQHL